MQPLFFYVELFGGNIKKQGSDNEYNKARKNVF